MHETKAIVETLKKELRAQKITYQKVAEHLELSEASVKRLFANYSFTLDRLESVAALANMRLSDLTRLAEARPELITKLSLEQEALLVKDPQLLLVTLLTLNHWSIDIIVKTYRMTREDVMQQLFKLDRMGIIELQTGDRIKHRVSRHFSWHPNGPVQSYVERYLKKDFFDAPFQDSTDHLRFVGAMISHDSLSRIHKAIDQVLAQLDTYIQEDAELHHSDKIGVAAVLAIRPWEMPAFRALRRQTEPS